MEKEEKNKMTFITIVVLLSIFSLFAIIGTIKHIVRDVNIKKQFKFNNQLYFYSNGDLLGTYECLDITKCDYATYSNGTKSSIIGNKYALIKDKNAVILYNIVDSKKELAFEEVKQLSNSVYAIKKNNLWGAALISGTFKQTVDFKYSDVDYINNKFIVLDNNMYRIISGDKIEFSTGSKIVGLNDKYIILDVGGNEVLSDYSGKRYFDNIASKTITIIDNYFLIKRQADYYLYDLTLLNETANYKLLGNFQYSGQSEVTYNFNNNTIEFYGDNNLLKTIELPVV